ncbi:MAG: DUF4162 domain-containing protein, partial [Muribaculaceae bacterium]|nr:DUF4162 domain-containing protein [Muribaculaceae bacterium]
LDDPFSGFDPINGALLQQLIDRLHKKGTTVMLSSHNMHAVEEMCDSIALINQGHLLLAGAITDIKEYNKTDEILVTTSSSLNKQLLNESGLIKYISDDVCRNSRKGYAYKLLKNDAVVNATLISEIAKQSDVLHFEEALPSLNDIFIKYTVNKQ